MKNLFALLLLTLFSTTVVANDTGAWFDPMQDGHGIGLFEFPVRESNDRIVEKRVFWWYAHDEDGDQIWLLSSVEDSTTDEFLLYFPTVSFPDFPTGDEIVTGEPVGTAELISTRDGEFIFRWDLLAEDLFCEDVYGVVAFEPFDDRCLDAEGEYDGDILLVDGDDLDEEGSSRFVRLTPAPVTE